MDFTYDEDALRMGARFSAWLDRELPPDWADTLVAGSEEWIEFQREWDRKLYAGGWAGAFWPVEFGGLGATFSQRAIIAQLMAERGAPEGLGKVGKRLLAPILMSHGTPEQQARFLPPMLRGEEFWCQGFSEPGAGSDLAGLSTRAVLDGDRFILNGQKIWTTYANAADWCFVLARTAPPAEPGPGGRPDRHHGMSLILVDLSSPGASVRPIRQINRGADFNEIFFTDVEVPATNLVGPLHGGWNIAMTLLTHERGLEVAFGTLAFARNAMSRLLNDLAVQPPERQAAHAYEVGRLQALCLAIQVNALRLAGAQQDNATLSRTASVLRLQASTTWSDVGSTALALAPADALDAAGRGWKYVEDYLSSRGVTISSGTAEIQRNIIAKRILGYF